MSPATRSTGQGTLGREKRWLDESAAEAVTVLPCPRDVGTTIPCWDVRRHREGCSPRDLPGYTRGPVRRLGHRGSGRGTINERDVLQRRRRAWPHQPASRPIWPPARRTRERRWSTFGR